MRGFIASLDAILAIILITGIVSGSLYMLDGTRAKQRESRRQQGTSQ